MLRILPEAKTYLPGPERCIYCPSEKAVQPNLTREHIIAKKLGGQLILHRASCRPCADVINKAIEIPSLAKMWLMARAHLDLPTSQPQETLRVGRWKDSGEALPKDMAEVDFRFDDIAKAGHPFTILQVHFEPPGILSSAAPTIGFQITGIESYSPQAAALASDKGERSGIFQPFSPDVTCRFIAKIAHGAAVAELGIEAFEPFLPDLIMGRSPYLSHVIGSSPKRGRRRQTLHRIELDVMGKFLVAHVQLFAKFGFRPYLAVVGRPKPPLRTWHISSSRTISIPRQ